MDHELLSPLRDPRALAEPDWQALEDRLHASCIAGQTSPVTAVSSQIPDWRRWMAAAAAVAMAAAITFYTVPSRNIRPQPQPQPGTERPAPRPMTQPEPGRIEAAPVPATPPRPRRRVTRPPAAAVVEARLNEFIPLPGAFALPDFESGRIVRMEVPLTGLPAFGIDLVPDAGPAAVEADFLIGQDGLPRAIRLASTRAQ